MEHPNTARIEIGDGEKEMSMVGVSIGGGSIEIAELNGFPLRMSGGMAAILVVHEDRAGTVANVAVCLAKYAINIGHMEVSRKERGNMALMVIEVDQNVSPEILAEIELLPNITKVTRIKN